MGRQVFIIAVHLAVLVAKLPGPTGFSQKPFQLASWIRLADQLFYFVHRMDDAGNGGRDYLTWCYIITQ